MSTLRERLRPFGRSLRPLPYGLGLALLVAASSGEAIDPRAPNRSAALAEVLSARGLLCEEADITWVSGPRGVQGAMFGGARALVRAHTAHEPSDLYLVAARLSPEGVLLAAGSAWNLTHSMGVDEARPVLASNAASAGAAPADGETSTLVATTTSLDGIVQDVHLIDLAGQSPALYTDFTAVQRAQTAVTNLQQTGQTSGVVHQVFELDPPASRVELGWEPASTGAKLTVVADNRRVVIDVQRPAALVVEGGGWVRARTAVKAPPGRLLTWAVDRVRAIPWFGEEKMQVVKALAFTALDWVMRVRARISPDSTEQEVAQDLAGINRGSPQIVITDPELGWPPAAIKPILSPPLPGEGQWISLDKDPFIRQTPGLPSPFVTSFVRADKSRHETRVYVTLWDPRQIALHMQAGTVEPVSATGEAGPGEIPRTPEVFNHLVAGFNGGFQAMHGEYGMQADGVLYLPPKPYAASVLEMKDGSTTFGAWPAAAEVPDDVLSFRQNLTALVQDDRFNPWGRTWWGGTPKGWADEVHTTRSGLCITKENFVGYFWGNDISADVLANAMLAGRCAFGLHLDMNTGHAGFEFFNAQPKGELLPLGRPLQQDWEFEGSLKSMPDFRVRARRMVKGMGHMNFPRYIHRDERDFFYLTRRPLLPGRDIPPAAAGDASAGEGVWRVKGLPQHGFPYAMAATWRKPIPNRPDVKVRVLRIDPRTVRAAASAGTTEATPTVVSFSGGARAKPGELAIWLTQGESGDAALFLAGPAPASDAPRVWILAAGEASSAPSAKGARAFAGIDDEEGMLVWIELDPASPADAETTAAIDALLGQMGCGTRLAVHGDAHAFPGGHLDVAGEPATPASTTVRLVRGETPGAHLQFASTPIVRPSVWQPLQSQRVRYFNKKSKSVPDGGAPR
ncbi:hypothetical protein [Pendulispora albinea]|uniref:Uncharacterized protein n=1 Tax=Pendulispora albinea TaxID=2741071 RepID=A0ABZ2LQC8_9BACT